METECRLLGRPGKATIQTSYWYETPVETLKDRRNLIVAPEVYTVLRQVKVWPRPYEIHVHHIDLPLPARRREIDLEISEYFDPRALGLILAEMLVQQRHGEAGHFLQRERPCISAFLATQGTIRVRYLDQPNMLEVSFVGIVDLSVLPKGTRVFYPDLPTRSGFAG